VHQIAAESGLGAVIDALEVPIHPGTHEWARRHGGDALGLALAGGEDYELLFAVSRRDKRNFFAAIRQSGDLMVTRIGRLRPEPGVWIDRGGRLEPLPAGFVHF
jgi:thiamine-monophosphate kinase